MQFSISLSGCRLVRLFVVAIGLSVLPLPNVAIVRAQDARTSVPTQNAGSIEGVVTTQSGSVRLAGSLVTLRDASGEVATAIADADGHYRLADVKPGIYQITASLDGFDPRTVPATVVAGKALDLPFDLPIAGVAERIEVSAPTSGVSGSGTLNGGDEVRSKEMEELSPSGGFQSALRLLASVLEVPGGVSIKGGRPNQSSVQIGPTTLVDPSTGFTRVFLPDDAIESVAVMPNPYAVEFGRFSSGLVVLRPRRAGDVWKTRLNDLDPTFRTSRSGNPVDVVGIGSLAPRIETGGPILRDRLFLEQTAQFRLSKTDVPSRPENELRTDQWFSSFTRVDANLSPKHTLLATGGIFPRATNFANLGTFTPPEATVDLHSHVNHGAITERALWSDTFFTETSVQMHQYETRDDPQGSAAMVLKPDTASGNFYNRQQRQTSTLQIVETGSGSRNAWGGLHLYKFGIDLLHNDYDGSSASRSISILRGDDASATLSRRLEFTGPAAQSIASTDVAVYAQDRVQPTTRWYVEFGGRLDRDGITNEWNPTPRIGTALLLNASGSAVLRGGFGVFYERTPSTAGVFKDFENYVDTRFAADGVTPLSTVLFTHVAAPNLQTPRSVTWDAAYDHRLSASWAIHFGVIDRTGAHELVVEPFRSSTTTGQLLLNSTGRSNYREAEAGVHFTHSHGIDLNVSYIRSSSHADLNSLTNYFDTLLWPIIGQNQYAPSNDVPHRLLARGRAMPTSRWLLLGIFDWRSGLPYSVVNDQLDFVGTRNDRRFPSFMRTELGIEHRFHILKLQPWIGVRADNAFRAFLPTDVQGNLASPLFGTFYNSEYRQFRIQVRFER
jgi:hypothetical protein